MFTITSHRTYICNVLLLLSLNVYTECLGCIDGADSRLGNIFSVVNTHSNVVFNAVLCSYINKTKQHMKPSSFLFRKVPDSK